MLTDRGSKILTAVSKTSNYDKQKKIDRVWVRRFILERAIAQIVG